MNAICGSSRTARPSIGRGVRVRRLLLQASDLEIDLEITLDRARDEAQLGGRVAADRAEVDGGIVRLSTGTAQRTARLSVRGDFELNEVQRGAHRLEIEFDDRRFEIPILPV
jgi:hypothetical protein